MQIARFNTKTTTTCTQTITHTLTLMTVGRYYPAHTHLSLCRKVAPLIPQYCVKIKTSLTTNYCIYYVIKWYTDTDIFYFSIYHLLIIKESTFILGTSALIYDLLNFGMICFLKSWLLHCMSDVKFIFKLLSSSYCNNCPFSCLPHEKQNTEGNYTDPTW